MTDPLYITTAIPYVNARPHIGFALEIVFADVLARWNRQIGREVHFLTGTDENSLTNVLAAEREGIGVRELVDRNAGAFEALGPQLALTFDDFIRTSADPRHPPAVERIWRACEGRGDIYRGVYAGWYCTSCEVFYPEEEVPGGRCPDHSTPLDYVEEENYFFRLSKYRVALEDLVGSGALRIIPDTRGLELMRLIEDGLEDISISRSKARARGWGIPVPDDPSQVVYVWFDALINYISALGLVDDSSLYRRFWEGEGERVHVIGKNIVRQHGIYWPAMLMSAGLPLPSTLVIHGFITAGGSRMSKSRGNVIDPLEVVGRYGADVLRWGLLRRSPFSDSDFTLDDLERAYNSELADSAGNLVSRVTAMLDLYRDGVIPHPSEPGPGEGGLGEAAALLGDRYAGAMGRFEVHEAMASVFDLAREANRYIVQVRPWDLAKDPRQTERLDGVLYLLADVLRLIAVGLAPFMPGASAAIRDTIGDGSRELDLRPGASLAGARARRAEALFPKIEGKAGI